MTSSSHVESSLPLVDPGSLQGADAYEKACAELLAAESALRQAMTELERATRVWLTQKVARAGDLACEELVDATRGLRSTRNGNLEADNVIEAKRREAAFLLLGHELRKDRLGRQMKDDRRKSIAQRAQAVAELCARLQTSEADAFWVNEDGSPSPRAQTVAAYNVELNALRLECDKNGWAYPEALRPGYVPNPSA